MSAKISQLVELISQVQNMYGTSLGTSVPDLRKIALGVVAERYHVDPNTIADIYIRRLAPDITCTSDFDSMLEDLIHGRSTNLISVAERQSDGDDRASIARLRSLFSGQSVPSASGGPSRAGRHVDALAAGASSPGVVGATASSDGSGHRYFDVGNIRITALPQTWDQGKPGIRLQAYKGAGQSLFQGAEIPIASKADAYDLIDAIIEALNELGVK